ncbi:hypothetical protein Sango_1492300 [Sesamum angolense]|uniref:Uncharacterized protein n=1 Tax=Sesamum angolense TaxID=2727404 RepID=A0AAE2BSX4_9LAMI|nr:hypothetical protein Sango_1492300 [Sesamum angolense]
MQLVPGTWTYFHLFCGRTVMKHFVLFVHVAYPGPSCLQLFRKKNHVRLSHVENGKFSLSFRLSDLRKQSGSFRKVRRIDRLLPLASADDGVTDEDNNTGLVQLLHDAARVFELAIKEQSSLSKIAWFSTAWLGVDKSSWAKALSYQASVYALLQAASEISSRGDGRDRDINVFVQRRYLIGGSVLYYPQLSAISSYQLYVEVVCEELDWLPFHAGTSCTPINVVGHKTKEGPPNAEAIPLVLDVCSHWIESFIKYSKWLENPSNVKAARHNKLKACMEELGIQKSSLENLERDQSPVDKESLSFDKALESVEEALLRLEELLQELHVSSSSSGKEHLKAACSDLERIRRLKKEAEFLEASFRAKEASLQQDDGFFEHETASEEIADSESSEIQRFELLRSELMELEKRVQRSADRCEYEEVTAVGHAAMLAAIQRYMPSLIPSTYGPERLYLLRQLEKVKEMEDGASANENAEE